MAPTRVLSSARRNGLTLFLISVLAHLASSTFCPPSCDCDKDYTRINCSDRVLFSIPSLPPTARVVDLSRNFLGPLLNGSIAHLHNLTDLDLSDNELDRLTDCSLVGLQRLVRLNLSRNSLQQFPEALFDPDCSLEVLDLSHNAFGQLPDAAFKNLRRLRSVNFSHNALTRLWLGVRWQQLKELEHLDLSFNSFPEVPTDAFEMTHVWPPTIRRSLNLAHCGLEAFQNNSLSQFRGLHSLNLSGNCKITPANLSALLQEIEHTRLKELDISSLNVSTIRTLFNRLHHLALTRLDLADNAIGNIPNDTFINLRSLQWLGLAGNKLSKLEPGLGALGNLKGLDLSRNIMESFQGPVVDQLGQLEYLNLANNKLELSSDINLSSMRELRTLNLQSNRLDRLVLPARTDQLQHLLLANNCITSLPSLARMTELQHFDIRGNELVHLGPYLFTSARKLQVADFRDNLIEEVDSRAFLPQAPKVVDLSNNLLRRLGYVSWTMTQEIHLQHNQLQELDLQTFHNMGNLTVLDLSRNNLSNIQSGVFRHLGNLQHLNLHGNALQLDPNDAVVLFSHLSSLLDLDLGHNDMTFLNVTTFHGCVNLKTLILSDNHFKVLEPALFENIPNLERFDATNNPFHCGCDLIPFRRWLGETDLEILDSPNGTYGCRTPPWRDEKHISFYTVSRFECNQSLYYMIIFGTVGAVIIVTGVFSSILVHQYFKQRHKQHAVSDKTKASLDQKNLADVKVDRVRFEHHDSFRKNQYLENLMRDPYGTEKKLALENKSDPYPIVLNRPLILVEKKKTTEHHKKNTTSKKEKSTHENKSGASDKKRQQGRDRSSHRSSQHLHNLLRYYTLDPRSQREIIRASQALARAKEYDKDHPHYHTLPGPIHSSGSRDLRLLTHGAPYQRPRVMSKSYHHLPEVHWQRRGGQQRGVNLTRAQSEYPLTGGEPDFDHPRLSDWV